MKFALLYTPARLDVPLIVNVEESDATSEEIIQSMIDEIEDCAENKDVELLNVFKETMVAWVNACRATRSGLHLSLSSGCNKVTLYAQTDLKAEGISRAQ